jgi:hypothetical protein
MKTGRGSIGFIMLAIGLILLNCNLAHAIEWMHPITTEDGYSARMAVTGDGIEVYISESKTDNFYDIQAISKNSIPLKEKRYKITFEAISNSAFDLYSRLGESDVRKGNSYKDYSCLIDNYDKWKFCSHEFNGYRGKNILYFQFGYAPKGTTIKIRNIQIAEIE